MVVRLAGVEPATLGLEVLGLNHSIAPCTEGRRAISVDGRQAVLRRELGDQCLPYDSTGKETPVRDGSIFWIPARLARAGHVVGQGKPWLRYWMKSTGVNDSRASA